MKARARGSLVLVLLAAAAGGCQGWPPSRRLQECRNRSHALQAELAQLKDESLRLRTRNRELARQAVEDAERLQTLEAERSELNRGALALQREREELAEAFVQLRQQLQAAADGPTRASLERETDTR
jgi:predicted nuclease with TOPRIM domain